MNATRVESVLFDTSAFLALARRDRRAQQHYEVARQQEAKLYLSAVSLAELLPGPDEMAVNWTLKLFRRCAVASSDFKDAARLMASTGTGGHTVDALIAVAALRLPRPLVVLTSDPDDLRRLLAGPPGVVVVRV